MVMCVGVCIAKAKRERKSNEFAKISSVQAVDTKQEGGRYSKVKREKERERQRKKERKKEREKVRKRGRESRKGEKERKGEKVSTTRAPSQLPCWDSTRRKRGTDEEVLLPSERLQTYFHLYRGFLLSVSLYLTSGQ